MLSRCQVVLPPTQGSSKSKYVYYGKVPCQYHAPSQLSAIVGIQTRKSSNKKSRVNYGHVWCLSCQRQSQTGSHSKNKAGHLKPESSAIGAKTGTPEISYFLQSYIISMWRRCQQSQTVIRSQERDHVVLNLSQPC